MKDKKVEAERQKKTGIYKELVKKKVLKVQH